eukprot:scaffold1831_cov198-Alexandrium_tamarense.AAC.13
MEETELDEYFLEFETVGANAAALPITSAEMARSSSCRDGLESGQCCINDGKMSGEREEGKIFAVVEGGSRRRGSAWLLKFKLNEHVRGEFMKLEKKISRKN